MTKKEIKGMQELLRMLGYYRGKIDGIWGPRTRDAYLAREEHRRIIGLSSSPIKPKNRKELEQIFGPIKYANRANGCITITNNFAKKYLTTIELPIVGRKRVHRLLVGKFHDAFWEINDRWFSYEIRTFGTVAYRHMLNRPDKPLSTHCYGIAVDINASENPYGSKECKLHPVIIKAFKRQGFTWGGDWRKPDNMHFQYYM